MGVISKPYVKLQRELHEINPAYGSSGHLHAGKITRAAVKHMGAAATQKPVRVLDYGCGKQTLKMTLPPDLFEYVPYDPAFAELAHPPAQADVVACLDVMEHVEPQHLPDVLRDVHRVTRYAAVMTISTRPAGKTLTDGRNAHLIVQPTLWWIMQLDPLFELQTFENLHQDCFWVELTPR